MTATVEMVATAAAAATMRVQPLAALALALAALALVVERIRRAVRGEVVVRSHVTSLVKRCASGWT